MLRLVLLAIAFVTTSGLQVAVTARPAAARSAVRMALPSMEDARSLSADELEKEIVTAKKELFELRKKVKTRQQVKPHLFTHTKHRISQLQTLAAQRE